MATDDVKNNESPKPYYGVVYRITNKVNGKCYIGQTTRTAEKRWREHISDALYETNAGKPISVFHMAIIKHGKEQFLVEELFHAFDKKTLDEYEHYFLTQYNTKLPFGYNTEEFASGTGPRSAHVIDKLRKAHSGFNCKNKTRPVTCTDLTTGVSWSYKHLGLAKEDGYIEHKIKYVCNGTSYSYDNKRWKYADAEDFIFLNKKVISEPIRKLKAAKAIRKAKAISIIGKNILTGEEKIWDAMVDVMKDGFNFKVVFKICNHQAYTYNGWTFRYSYGEYPNLSKKTAFTKPRAVIGKNILTGEEKIYECIADTRKDGFTPVNVGKCCRKEHGRQTSKGYIWRYL